MPTSQMFVPLLGIGVTLLIGGILLIAAVSPMTPLNLLLYELAFAGGTFILGLALLLLYILLLLILGSKEKS